MQVFQSFDLQPWIKIWGPTFHAGHCFQFIKPYVFVPEGGGGIPCFQREIHVKTHQVSTAYGYDLPIGLEQPRFWCVYLDMNDLFNGYIL